MLTRCPYTQPHAVAATRRLASAGNIVRALLIQLQASARDAQVALAAVDDLLAAQTVTIRALARCRPMHFSGRARSCSWRRSLVA